MATLHKLKAGLSALVLMALVLAASWAVAQDRLEVVEMDGDLQWAKIDPALRGLEEQNKITVRALRGFGRLPEQYSKLVLDLRKEGVDLLAAGPKEIQELAAKAESGTLKADPQLLADLQKFLENKDYHAWAALKAGETLEVGPDTMLRGQGRALLQDSAGQERVLEHSGEMTTLVASLAKPQGTDSISGGATRGWGDTLGAGDVTEQDQPVLAHDQPMVSQDQPVPAQMDVPLIWAKAPGMRLFGVNAEEEDADEDWGMYAALCPALDGGYLAAASVPTPAGLQAWAVHYDSQGMPLWSRTLGGPFGMRVTGATALENGTFLLGGILDEDQPGFLLALDEQGQVLWSQAPDRKWKEHGGKDIIFAVSSHGKEVVAAGQVMEGDKELAVLLNIPAKGGTGWRTKFKDGFAALAVLPDKDGWIVGGGSSLEGKPWLAKVNAKGEILWSKTYGTEKGYIAALVQTPAGEILAAGDGPMWRVLDKDGELLREVPLSPSFDGVLAIRNVQGMALGAEGEIWLAGEAESAAGWLAKVALDGQPQWLRFYGQSGGENALKAVLPRAHGAVAVGRSFLSGEGLWLVQVDEAGTPLVAEEKETALEALIGNAALIGQSQGLSALHVARAEDSLRLAMPFVVAENGLPGFGDYPADLGLLSFQGKPAGAPGRWNMTAQLPERILLRGQNGQEAGVLVADKQKLSFVFDESLAVALALDADLKDLRIEPLKKNSLHGLHADLGLEEMPETLDQASLARLTAQMKLDQDKNGRWKGPLNVELKDWQRIHGEKKVGELKKLQIKAQYEELDLAANTALIQKLEDMLAEEPSSADVGDLIQDYTGSMGAGQGEVVLSGFFLADASSEDSLAIKEITATGEAKISEAEALARDMHAVYAVKGLAVQLDSRNVTMDQASLNVALDRFNFGSIAQAVAQVGEENGGWQSSLSKTLGGVDMQFSIKNLHVAMPEQPAIKLGQGDLRLALSGLDSPLVGVSLTYDHKDIVGIPMVPEEVLPRSARFDLALENLPLTDLLADPAALEANPLSALSALAAHATKLHIKALNVDAPLGGLFCTAEGVFEEGEDETPPTGRLRADIKVRSLKDIVDWIANMLGEGGEDIRNTGQALEKAGKPAGDMLQYAVEADTNGAVQINGQSMEQVLGGGEETPAQ